MSRARDIANQATTLDVDGGTIKLDGNYPVGTNNVALGDTALDDGSLTGAANTAIGASALTANTSGANNTAIGRSALLSNTTGINNSAIGETSLYSNQSGGQNVAVGKEAMFANTTASNNTAVGHQALTANTTGHSNAILGIQSGYSNTTGTENTFVGPYSGYFMTTGSKNTILGRYNGNQGGLDIRTSSNYIVLSDGDGNPRLHIDSNGDVFLGLEDNSSVSRISSGFNVTVADDATLTVLNAEAGACTVHVYDTSTGAGAVFFASYLEGTTIIAQADGTHTFATSDTDGAFCLFKNTNSHVVTFKNRFGSSRNMRIAIFGSVAR